MGVDAEGAKAAEHGKIARKVAIVIDNRILVKIIVK